MKWKQISIFAGMAICLCMGIALGHYCTKPSLHHFHNFNERDLPGMVMRKVAHKLDLSSEQVEKLTPIIKSFHDEGMRIRQQIRPQISDAIKEAMNDAKPHLNEEQIKKLDRFYERFKEHFEDFNSGAKTSD